MASRKKVALKKKKDLSRIKKKFKKIMVIHKGRRIIY